MTIPNWAHEIITLFRGRVKGDEIFIKICPYCGNARWNFQVSISICAYHCWACNAGKNATIQSFLKEFNIEFDYAEIKPTRKKKQEESIISLPPNKKIMHNELRIAGMARQYLNIRDVDEKIIEDWDMRIGTGNDKNFWGIDYFGWTVVPFYGLNGLEYFCAVNHAFENKYYLPSIGKDKFIPKRRGSDKIALVEGLFDATTVWKYTDYDVLPLFGKFIGKHQLELLLRVNYEMVFICLDSDAILEAAELADKIRSGGGSPYLVRLPDKFDPNAAADRINIYIDSAEKFGLTTKSKIRRERLLHA